MYIGFYNFYKIFNRNRIFVSASSPLGDDMAYPFVRLGEFLRSGGHRVSTIDMDKPDRFDAVVFFDFPTLKDGYFKKLLKIKPDRLYLMIYESELHRPDNFAPDNHRFFRKIFTWHDGLIDNNKYFKINYVQKDYDGVSLSSVNKEKFCAMIVSNKFVSHKFELYSERIKAIRWFETNHPEEFDLYGIGWDEYSFRGPKIIRALNRIKPLKKIFGPYYPSYKGRVKRKRDVLRKYKFSICYENARGFPGYITEKIFDCFFAGCVPVYLGASNITEHIPPETFIDKSKFDSYKELYEFMKGMDEAEYRKYLVNIESFLKSDRFYQFSSGYFNGIVSREIVNSK